MVTARLAVATESDLGLVLDILAEAAIWLRDERGIPHQWSPAFPHEKFAQAARDRELYLICSGQVLAGTVRIQLADERVWGRDDGTAVYCHSLAIRRRHSGQGLGGAALNAAQELGAALDRPVLRLDCMASNSGLRRYYEELGFQGRGEVTYSIEDGARWTCMRYERPALPAA
ncbi:MAG TPA: GNAT family N-acetyltransferase [Streptosporangiaceae bacterium]|nr:GNAT family N-acetyltransferase [Streptosporangiaceae bacterium]